MFWDMCDHRSFRLAGLSYFYGLSCTVNSVLLGLKCLIQHLNIEQLSQCFSTQTVFSLCLLHNTKTATWIRDAFVQLESQNRLKLKEHLTLSWIG